MTRTIYAADLFCGAGGASVGLRRACEALGLDFDLLAVNHWPKAVETHMLNHPGVRHLCEAVERVSPREAVPGGRLHLLLAGPSCVHHSRARGGRPVNDQQRASAWCILRWASELTVDTILVENVPEFLEWGPVGVTGRPIKAKKGEAFRAWVTALEALTYRVEWQILNAADYGDPTTRRRLWVIARRARRRIAWPGPTHSRTGGRHLFGATQRWRPAREIIDWSIPGQSIFGRKKPLSAKTMQRILAGLERFGGAALKPFLVQLTHGGRLRSCDEPLATITGGQRGDVALVEPFLVQTEHQGGNGAYVRSADDPLPTLTTCGGIGVCEPFLVPNNENNRPKALEEPLATVTGGNRHYLCQPFIVPHRTFDNMHVDSVERPLRTITAVNARQFGLAQPVLVPMFGEREGQAPRAHSVDEPLPTVTASKGGPALVEPIITSYYGGGGASPVSAPLPTATARDRFGLVMPEVDGHRLDIRFRMLQPHELAAAMSFDPTYRFAGNRGDQVRQIGNAWPCRTAEALVREVLAEHAAGRAPARAREATA